MVHARASSASEVSNVETLATGWQELARQVRFLSLRGSAVPPDDLKRLQTLLAEGVASVGAIARGETQAPQGLQVYSSERGIAMRMLQSGCPAADGVHPSDGVDRAPSRSHVLTLTPEGRGLHAEIAPLALAYEAALIAGLAPEEVTLLKRLLGRLQSAAGQLAGEAPSSPSLR